MPARAELMHALATEKDPRKRTRIHGICRIVIEEESYREVARIMYKSYNTIRARHERYLREGLKGLGDRPRPGRPPKMTNRKLTEFMEEGDAPCRFPKLLAEKVKEKTGIAYCEGAVRRKLRDGGYSPKVPEPARAGRESVKNVAKWQKSLKPWLLEAENDGFLPFVVDECSLLHDYQPRRSLWTLVGKRACERYAGNHARRMIFGALSMNGDQAFMNAQRFDTETTIKFFRRVTARHGPVALLVDRATPHRSIGTNDFVKDNEGLVRIGYFPTGWPELNPVESCWNTLKRQPHAHQVYPTVDARIAESMEYLRTHRFHLDVTRFLFREPVAKII